MPQSPPGPVYRFGGFEFDPALGELRKSGIRIQLQGQPGAVLHFLLERAGDLVTRRELQERLWPAETFVDFERGLNAAVTRLRVALGDSAGRPRYLETLPRRGYRFLAPVTRAAHGPESGEPRTEGQRRLIVMPFEQLHADTDTAFLRFSLPDAITNSLAGVRNLVVRSSRMAGQLAPLGSNLPAIATQADVDAVITGTLLRSGEQLRVSAQLIDFPSGTVVWTHVAQVSIGEMFALQDELTRRIVSSLVPAVSCAGSGPRANVPRNARAYEYYLRANYLSTQMRDLELARQMYRQCLAEDPGFAPAWGRLARCHRILAKFRADPRENLASAEEAFQRAFALDPRSPGIHSSYAYHETEQGRAKEAMARLLGVLRDNQDDPEVYAGLVHACRYAGLTAASLAADAAARRLDRNARTSVMNTYFALGRYEEAVAASSDDVGYMEAMVMDGLGHTAAARERVRHREHLPPLMHKWMLMLEAYLEGREEDAVAGIREIDEQGVDPEGFFYRGRLLARLGRKELALSTLSRASAIGYYCAPAWREDPYLHCLRDEPRFLTMADAVTTRCEQARRVFEEGGGTHLLRMSGP